MKILITTDLFCVETNGVVTSVKNLWGELLKQGHDVRILTLSETGKSHREGDVTYIRSHPIGVYPGVRMSLSCRNAYIREIIGWAPDVIHSQCEFFTFRFAKFISRRTGAPIVHTYHTLYEQYVSYILPGKRFGAWVVRVLSRALLRRVHTVVVPTQKVMLTLRGYGVQNPILVIPSGISLDQHRIRLAPGERLEKRRALGLADDATILLNLGRLGTEKNLEELLRLYAEAVKTDAKLVFLIVGDGPDKAHLEALAKKLQISDSVIFTGKVAPCEVQNYYQLGDLFVSASTSETQGLTYVEAAANGLPLLCRRDPCLADVIREGENGYTYESDAEFFEALQRFVADPAWRARAGRCSEEISAAFDKHRFGESVDSLYRAVAEQTSR